MVRFLASFGVTISFVNNGADVLNYLLDPAAQIPHLIMIKVGFTPAVEHRLTLQQQSLPVQSGLDTALIIRPQQPFASNPVIRSIPLIAMTAHSMPGDLERLRQYHFDDSIRKPFRRHQLPRLLQQWSKGREIWGPVGLRRFPGPRSRM
ncbi:hypothetical protein PHISP_05081 [Aspergillus sp. HF37]|nr:hypothetical protein PHISP_05081 [Aspergillus sp. HF37]